MEGVAGEGAMVALRTVKSDNVSFTGRICIEWVGEGEGREGGVCERVDEGE